MNESEIFDAQASVCANCAYGVLADDGDIVCPQTGIMQQSSTCKKFKYDPLKRKPKAPVVELTFSPEDFEL